MAEENEKKVSEESTENPVKKKYSVVFRPGSGSTGSVKLRTTDPAKKPVKSGVSVGAGKAIAPGTKLAVKNTDSEAAEEKPKKLVKKITTVAPDGTKTVKKVVVSPEEVAEEKPKKTTKKAAEKTETETAEAAKPKKTTKKAAEAPAAETEEKPKKTTKKKAEEPAEKTEEKAEKPAKKTTAKTATKKAAPAEEKEAAPEPQPVKPAPRFVDMDKVRAANQPIKKTPVGKRTGSSGGYNPSSKRQGQDGNRQGGFNKPAGGQNFGNRQGQNNRPQGKDFQGQGQQRPSYGQRQPNAYELAMQKPGKNGKNSRGQGNRFDKKNSDELRRPGVKVSDKGFVRPGKPVAEPTEPQIKMITIPETLTIKDLADAMKIQPSAIVKKLFMKGEMVTVNEEIDYEKAENIAVEFDVLCEKEIPVDVIAELVKDNIEDTDEQLVGRPPVVCVMGHVDHGKTSLLDAIRKTNVTSREAGGITQAIGAYMVEINGRKLTFLDTPGHEAFTAMRMRGAQATDIAILVVAADDGVMPQTIEAINHAKAAEVEIVVAINKIDKPGANIDRVKQELTEYGLVAEDWGGSTTMVPVSAKSGEGISDLLEMVLLDADVLELKANPNRNARGLVIEAKLDKGRGPVATVLVQKGTLRVGNTIAAGASYGKIRAMIDDKGQNVKVATPSTPVEILGLSDVPNAGEIFVATDSEKDARSFAQTFIAEEKKRLVKNTRGKASLDDIFEQIKEGELKELNLIVKADVQGSVEAVKESLEKLSNEEVVVKVIHSGAGNINESDVTLAAASNAIIIGFNVKIDATAKSSAESEKIDIRMYDIIYKAIEDVEAAMKGMLDPVFEEKVIGHAVVRQTFKASSIGIIAGCFVLDGKIIRGCKCRITRGDEQIFDGNLASLKRFKDDAKEVREGYECGLVFDGFGDLQEDDQIEAYDMVEVPRS